MNTCRTCRFAEQGMFFDGSTEKLLLWCKYNDEQAVKACSRYEREPGADAPEDVE